MGVGVGMTPDDVQRLGWVDEALSKLDKKRNIGVFTRHYQAAIRLAEQDDLIVTLPSLAVNAVSNKEKVVVLNPPFEIPKMGLKMVWSPLLQHDPGHKWMRQLIKSASEEIVASNLV
jgi:DNA-binding transcriptional LysR family regulator